jgi:flagellar hook-associated protein 2
MPTISSPGLGSGLDIQGLVTQLVAAERAPKERQLTQADARLTTEFTALASLKGALSALRGSVSSLRSPGSFNVLKATVGDENYFTASASSAAIPGSYTVQVAQLATAARLGSAAYADGPDSEVGTGTLSITVGERTFDIEITEDNASLAGIRDAINGAPGNTAVRATLIRDSAGTYLVLTGIATGAGNSISVATSNASEGLAQLAADLNDFDPERDLVAQDAIAYASGYEIRGSTNSLSGAIDGVTLNLKKVTPEGETIVLDVARDEEAILRKAESFVSAYNMLAQQIASLGRYDAATRTAGPMLGDSLLRGIDTQLRRMLSEPVAGMQGRYRTLTSLGIEMTQEGTLKLDHAKFRQALADDPDAVNQVFTSESGVAARMSQYLDDRLSASGEFAARDERISTQRRRIEKEREALDARMAVVQQRYLRQFTAMDALLAQMQNTSGYLAQQLESLASLSNARR